MTNKLNSGQSLNEQEQKIEQVQCEKNKADKSRSCRYANLDVKLTKNVKGAG